MTDRDLLALFGIMINVICAAGLIFLISKKYYDY